MPIDEIINILIAIDTETDDDHEFYNAVMDWVKELESYIK